MMVTAISEFQEYSGLYTQYVPFLQALDDFGNDKEIDDLIRQFRNSLENCISCKKAFWIEMLC